MCLFPYSVHRVHRSCTPYVLFFGFKGVWFAYSNLLPRYEIIIWTKRSEIPRLSFDRYFVMTQDWDRFPCPSDGFPFAVPLHLNPQWVNLWKDIPIYFVPIIILCSRFYDSHGYSVYSVYSVLCRHYGIMHVNNQVITMWHAGNMQFIYLRHTGKTKGKTREERENVAPSSGILRFTSV